MKPRDRFDRQLQGRLSRRFRQQYGVLARYQARSDGATDSQLRAQLHSGDWECIYRNVYRHPATPRSPEQTILAACLAAGPQAVASHESAAWLWGLIAVPPDSPTLTVPAPAHPDIAGVEIYRSKDLDLLRILEHRRIPCTDPLRTLVDLAGRVDADTLDEAIDQSLARQLVTVAGLVVEVNRLARHGRPGVPSLRRALKRRGFVGQPDPSVLESRTARAFQAHRVRLPKPQVVAGRDGAYRLDYAISGDMIALEVDGYVWHFSPEHKRRDEARRRQLVIEGWRVLVYTWVDVVRQPNMMVRQYLTIVNSSRSGVAHNGSGAASDDPRAIRPPPVSRP